MVGWFLARFLGSFLFRFFQIPLELFVLRGQVSLEALIAIAFMLGFVILVSFFVLQKNSDLAFLEARSLEGDSCRTLSSAIFFAYSSPSSSQAVFLAKDANVLRNSIVFSSHSCSFVGIAEEKALRAGKVVVLGKAGGVVFEQ